MPVMPTRRVISMTLSRPTAKDSSAATVLSDLASAIPQRHAAAAAVTAAVVLRMPAAATARGVAHRGGRRVAVLERGGIDVDLERGAGLATRVCGTVELALAVVRAAGHGAHRAVRLHQHDGAAGDAVAAVLGECRGERLVGRLLHVEVDGGAGRQHVGAAAGGDALHLLEGPVEEPVGAVGIAVLDGLGGMHARPVHLTGGVEAGFDEIVQAPRWCARARPAG